MENKNNGIVIVVESGSDLPKELAEKYGIVILPMHVMFDQHNYNDGTFPVSQIIDYYHQTKKIPTTSATNVGEYLQAFKKIHQEHPNKLILHLCYSAVTTATYQNAKIASTDLDYVYHIDTKFVSAGQTMIILKVAKYIQSHPECHIEDVRKYAYKIIEKTHMCFLPSQLDFLKAGGRVSNAAYLGANILKLKPLIEIKDGKLVATKKYRGRHMKKICLRMIDDLLDTSDYDIEDIILLYSYGLDEDILKESQDIVNDLGFQNIYFIETGGVITSHSGPGGFGVVFCDE
ncbi:DegV family protein [Candidatus Stoquefichus massiliensis]|uniref:DegV family protein n=1 Tax=Candidatus Stoquefichus massiliensis TaxID=1470350 RepID=UPI0004850B26|nr:DegV family protein [Candidatus Stoquefichus massiliensis]